MPFPYEMAVSDPNVCSGLPLESKDIVWVSDPIDVSSAMSFPPSSKVGLATTSLWTVVAPHLS